ncbi:MAG: cytochrome D1 domain-containing protein [Sinimarinibacterium flocculans]|uniref:cytochrome D1 domain-containing protein n=1 Tax=Sinimarinibacterium flocculans TaxID=985250 RepID=UPI003C4F5FD6
MLTTIRSALPALLWLILVTVTPAQADPQGRYKVYVTNEIDGTLSVIDGRSLEVTETVELGKRPRGVRLSPDGRRLYVALSGSPIAPPHIDPSTLPPPDKSADGIGVYDIASGRLERTLRGVSDPEQLVVSRDGSRLYIASEDTGTAVVMDADSGERIADIPVGGEPEGVGISPDGRFVYMTSEEDHTVAVIDTANNRVVKHIKVGLRPRSAAFSTDGRRAYVPGENDATLTVIDASTHEIIESIVLGEPQLRPMDVTIAPSCGSVWLAAREPARLVQHGPLQSPDCDAVFVSTGRGKSVVRVDATTHEVTGSATVGERPWGIGLSPDGRYLFTANGPSNDVSVVDTRTMQVVLGIEVGERPWGLVVAPVRDHDER